MTNVRKIDERVPGITILGPTPFFPPDADSKVCFHLVATPEILRGLGEAIQSALVSGDEVGEVEVEIRDRELALLRVATHTGVSKTTEPTDAVYILTNYD